MTRKGGSAGEVLLAFLGLGCRSFGGPVAHLGYFQREFVEKRKWVDPQTYAELIGIAQSMPGPASSQVGFSLGLLRAGWMGGLAAWVGFTLPSAVLMLAFEAGHGLLMGKIGLALVHALQLVAVAVVAQAVMAMQKTLAPDVPRLLVAAFAMAITLLVTPQFSTVAAIGFGAVVGLVVARRRTQESVGELGQSLPKGAAILAGMLFFALQLVRGAGSLGVFAAFYRSGALVFGGGHVMLPMLEATVVTRGWVSQPVFLAGYGAAQALPGPLFSFAAYLGASVTPSASPLLYGLVGLVGIFLPGLLAVAAVLPFWGGLRQNRWIRAGLWGVNASVVGVLGAALCRPLWTSSVHGVVDFLIVAAAFAALVGWTVQRWLVVAGTVVVAMVVRLA